MSDEYSRGTRVYVGGLNESVKKEDLEAEFEKYGKLNSVWVAFNPPGFAFIEFANIDDAETACDNMNGSDIHGSKLRVEISRGRGRGGRGGRGGGFRGSRDRDGMVGGGGGGGRYFTPRGGTRGYGGERGGYRGTRGGGRGRGSRGGYDDGGSYRSSRGSYGGGRDYDRNGRDGYGSGGGGGGGGGDYYGGRDTGSSRYRSRSPVGRGSSRDYSSGGYGGRSGNPY